MNPIIPAVLALHAVVNMQHYAPFQVDAGLLPREYCKLGTDTPSYDNPAPCQYLWVEYCFGYGEEPASSAQPPLLDEFTYYSEYSHAFCVLLNDDEVYFDY